MGRQFGDPLRVVLERLHVAGFEARLAPAKEFGFWLRWRKRDARWETHAATLDGLGERVLGWLDARESGDAYETDYATEGWSA